MIKKVAFKASHIREIEVQEEQSFYSDFLKANKDYPLMLEKMGLSFSAELEDGKIIGSCGVGKLNPHVLYAWGYFSKDVLRYPKFIKKEFKGFLEKQFDFTNIIRVQAIVPVEHTKASRFIEWLGFAQEGLLRKYEIGGRDAYIYAIVKECDTM